MDHIIMGDEAHTNRASGNKAANLSKLSVAAFDVPRFFVVRSGALAGHPSDASLESQIASALDGLAGSSFAVRSSSVEEDGADASFAGQFESYLDVAADDVVAFVRKVADSGSSEHVDTYRQSAGRDDANAPPAVIVQEMIDADVSGVAFGADPVNGDRRTRVVAATDGTADGLVSGDRQGDTWRIDECGNVTDSDLESESPVLDPHSLAEGRKAGRGGR